MGPRWDCPISPRMVSQEPRHGRMNSMHVLPCIDLGFNPEALHGTGVTALRPCVAPGLYNPRAVALFAAAKG